jgi:hypothetical protein
MRLLRLDLVQLLFSTELFLTCCHAYPVALEERIRLWKDVPWKRTPQDSDGDEPTFAVLGVGAVSDGSVHPRLEIRKLEQDKDQWNVFLLGLRRFQLMDQADLLSYYQISGMF